MLWLIFCGSIARGCFSYWHSYPLLAGKPCQHDQYVIVFAAHTKVSWLLSCPLGYTVLSFQTQLSQRSYSFTLPKVHSQPSFVLAREATACITDFCWRKPPLICMPLKNPALCPLSAIAPTGRPSRWHSQLHSLQLIALSGEPHSTVRNELLQPVSALHSRRRFYLSWCILRGKLLQKAHNRIMNSNREGNYQEG